FLSARPSARSTHRSRVKAARISNAGARREGAERERELRTTARDAARADPASVPFEHLLDDGQSQAASGKRAARARATKRHEQRLGVLSRKADAVVHDIVVEE